MREKRPASLRSMKASVIAGLKCEPDIRALKMSKMKKPHNIEAASPIVDAYSAVRKHVPRNSKSRIRIDSLKVVMQSCIWSYIL